MFRTVKIECFGQCQVVVEFLIVIDSGFSTLFLTLCLLTVLHIAICALCIRYLAVVLISSEHMLSVILQEFTDPSIT